MGILSNLKQGIKTQSENLLKQAFGMEFLDKEQTITYLDQYLVSPNQNHYVDLPEIRNISDPGKIIFEKNGAAGSRNQVWNLKAQGKKSSLLRIGSVVTDNKVLQTDYGYPNLFTDDFGGKRVFKDLLKKDKRPTFHARTVIAPWSQYMRKEYYLYIMFIAAKICRMKDVLPEDIYNEAVVSYPLYNTPFEREFLELLGFSGDRIVDSQKTRVTFDNCILGNNDDWAYQNTSDILSLRKHIESKIDKNVKGAGPRIYIQRSERRRVINEEELVKMLLRFDFQIIEDKPRSVAEQFAIYNNASFIMGPHGASFTNIIWCKPGTHLFELFPPTYVYNFFLYEAQVMGLNYSAYCKGDIILYGPYKTVNDNISVDVPEIEKYLEKVLS
jgi:hypothetical protein